jgi:hypothetical protein
MEIDPINSAGIVGRVSRNQIVNDSTAQATLEAAAEVNDYLHLSKAAREKARATESQGTESTSSLYQYFYNVIQVQLSKNTPVSKALNTVKNYFDKAAKFFSKDKNKNTLFQQDDEELSEKKDEGLVITLTDEHLSMLKRNDILKAEKGRIYEAFHRNDSDEMKGTLVNYKI